MEILKALACLVGAAIVIYGLVKSVLLLNQRCRIRYDFQPLTWQSTLGVFVCIVIALVGFAISKDKHEHTNLVVGLVIGVIGYLLILRHIACKSSTLVALGSGVLLLVLAAAGVVVLAVLFFYFYSGVEKRNQRQIDRGVDNMFGT